MNDGLYNGFQREPGEYYERPEKPQYGPVPPKPRLWTPLGPKPPPYTAVPPESPPVYPPDTPPIFPPESPPVSPPAKSSVLLLIAGVALVATLMADEG